MDISENEIRENWEVKKPEEGKKIIQTRDLSNADIDRARDQVKENGKEKEQPAE